MDHNFPSHHQFTNSTYAADTRPVTAARTGQQAPGGYPWIPGATTVGVVFEGGVLLAAEKRITYGYLIMSKGGKKSSKSLIK